MTRDKLPVTSAARVLGAHGVTRPDHPHAYEARGGAAVSARELGEPEHQRDSKSNAPVASYGAA